MTKADFKYHYTWGWERAASGCPLSQCGPIGGPQAEVFRLGFLSSKATLERALVRGLKLERIAKRVAYFKKHGKWPGGNK